MLLALLLPFTQLNFVISQLLQCDSESEEKLVTCAEELVSMEVFSNATSKAKWTDMGTKSQTHFIMTCRAYERFNDCLGDPIVKDACLPKEPFKSEYGVADAALDYACGEGYHTILLNWDCYLGYANDTYVTSCRDNFGHIAQDRMYTEYSYGSAACFAMQTYVDCLQPTLEPGCGTTAFEALVRSFENGVQVYLPHCRLSSSNGSAIFISVVLLLATCL